MKRAGLVEPEPKKRPKSSYNHFEADLPNECWQSDFSHNRLDDGTNTEILTSSTTAPDTPSASQHTEP
ncbi:hypothetical protein [Pseudolysinimonas yzui]|uniref:Transposase n=1 Tax=Pseudolysinimonas yzui TaxID=2708254 RepID=A0A8J3GTG7_9MICO|nr:hypothetical protein [Pseudolysinimonas yzui]GHF26664.1 hypothetical protein GCM10011600_29590 [Pseudolysinimonas yzui]